LVQASEEETRQRKAEARRNIRVGHCGSQASAWSRHEVDGHHWSASSSTSAGEAASGPEADVGNRHCRGAELGGGQAAASGPHGRRPARARGRAAVVVVPAGSVVVGEVQRRGGRPVRGIWSRSCGGCGSGGGGGGGALLEEMQRGGGGGAPPPAPLLLLLRAVVVVELLGDGLLELEPCGL